MTAKAEITVRTRRSASWLGGLALALAGALTPACTPDRLAAGPELGEGEIDAQNIFNTQALPIFKLRCQACHQVGIGDQAAFLPTDTEYQAITDYKSGMFLKNPAVQSLLIIKGPHEGPALLPEEIDPVKGWIENELVARGLGGTGSKITPTIPIANNDVALLSLSSFINDDPGAQITFKLVKISSSVYRIDSLTLVAGESSGIHITHPRFIILTQSSAQPESSDALNTIDMTVAKSTSTLIGNGTVPITNVPAGAARLAMTFSLIEAKDPTPSTNIQCKNFPAFQSGVLPLLTNPCGSSCHGGTQQVATSAFDMSPAKNPGDTAGLMSLCRNTLGRVDKANPANSRLLRQPDPAQTGHGQFKNSAATQAQFASGVTTWLQGEQ